MDGLRSDFLELARANAPAAAKLSCDIGSDNNGTIIAAIYISNCGRDVIYWIQVRIGNNTLCIDHEFTSSQNVSLRKDPPGCTAWNVAEIVAILIKNKLLEE